MSKLDDEYYVVLGPDSDLYPTLIPTEKSVGMKIQVSQLPLFGEPIFFEASERDDIEEDDDVLETHPLYLSKGSLVTVSGIKDYFEKYFLSSGMHFYPSVYIDEKDNWDEDYWYLNIYSEVDCWSRDKSKFITFSRPSGDVPDLRTISLADDVLSKIPERDRLIFRLGGTARAQLLIHQKVVDYFKEAQVI